MPQQITITFSDINYERLRRYTQCFGKTVPAVVNGIFERVWEEELEANMEAKIKQDRLRVERMVLDAVAKPVTLPHRKRAVPCQPESGEKVV